MLGRALLGMAFGRRLPLTQGVLRASDVSAPVRIRRDRYGIPYIEAETDHDAWFGLGFCQGQDRTFQIELLLRTVRGSLAELTGAQTLQVDRLSRRIGFRRAGERRLKVLRSELREMVEAFARGVTFGAARGVPRPHEFVWLRARPTPYEAADVLGLLALQGFLLASNWDAELARLKVLSEDGPGALRALDPVYREDFPVTAPPGQRYGPAADRLAEDLAVFLGAVPRRGASNSWIVAPGRTGTGRPLLAADPHLPPGLPAHWYLAHLRTPEWAATGAAFAGTPGFVAGHNDRIAWAATTSLADNTDLYLEELTSDGRVRDENGYVPCTTRTERIRVRKGTTVTEKVAVTPRGPIISPALEDGLHAMSLRATWLDPLPTEGILDIHRARTPEELQDTLRQDSTLGFHMVHADAAGDVGWHLIGRLPRRQQGRGTLPLPGWHPAAAWRSGYIPAEGMPSLRNPEAGFIAVANNPPIPANEAPFLGMDWVDGYRQARLTEVLQGRRGWDVESTQKLQADRISLPWRELRAVLLSAPARTPEARLARTVLEGWSGEVSGDSEAASVFEFFLAEMSRRVAQAKAPRATAWALGAGFTSLLPDTILALRRVSHLVGLLRRQPDGWFDRPWAEEIVDSLTEAVRALGDAHGDGTSRWRWGRVRPLVLRHPAARRWLLRTVFNRGPYSVGGDTNTVAQASVSLIEPVRDPLYVPSLRLVIDVGEWRNSRFAIPGGQSGNPFSAHYDDLLPYWLRGEGVPIAWTSEEIRRETRSVLTIEPDGPASLTRSRMSPS